MSVVKLSDTLLQIDGKPVLKHCPYGLGNALRLLSALDLYSGSSNKVLEPERTAFRKFNDQYAGGQFNVSTPDAILKVLLEPTFCELLFGAAMTKSQQASSDQHFVTASKPTVTQNLVSVFKPTVLLASAVGLIGFVLWRNRKRP